MDRPLLNLHQLRVFAAVIEEGTLTHAARALYLSQPAVSAQIRQLERLLGARVLVRQGRRMAPTPAGAALYRYASDVLLATDTLLQQVERARSGELDEFTVGGHPTASTYVLPGLLARFLRDYPNVRLSLVSAQSPELIELARRDTVDLAVLSAERVPPGLAGEVLGRDELLVVESGRHPLSSGQEISLEELSLLPFVRPLIGRDRLAVTLDRLLVEKGLRPRRFVMDLTTWEGLKEAVRAGAGLALTPRGVVQREIERGDLRPVVVAGYHETRTIRLVLSSRVQGREPSAAFRVLVERIKEELPTALGLQQV